MKHKKLTKDNWLDKFWLILDPDDKGEGIYVSGDNYLKWHSYKELGEFLKELDELIQNETS